jgi:O-antigen/teichoic acid export membrane protein
MMKAMLLTVVIGGGVLIVYWLFPDFIINRLFAGKYPLATPYLSKYGLAMAFWAISFLLLNYSLSLNRTKVAYPLLGAMVLQLGLISLFHSSIAQVVDIMLISSIACLALMCPLYLNVRRKHL